MSRLNEVEIDETLLHAVASLYAATSGDRDLGRAYERAAVFLALAAENTRSGSMRNSEWRGGPLPDGSEAIARIHADGRCTVAIEARHSDSERTG
jgi:hypothetical protein